MKVREHNLGEDTATMQPLESEESQINAMIEALDNPDWATRSAASASLTSMGERAREALLREIDSASMRRAVGAARILSDHNEPRILEVMKRLVVSPNPLLGQIAVEYIIRYRAEMASPFLLNHLPNCAYIVQITIVQALGKLGAKESFNSLIALLNTSDTTGSTLRLTVITALGALDDPRAIPILKSYLNDPDSHVSKRASAALLALENTSEEEPD